MRMHNPPTALIWESWRLGRKQTLIRLLVLLAIGALFSLPLGTDFEDREEFVAAQGLLLITTLFPLLLSPGSSDDRAGYPLYLNFLRPIPTWMAVIVPMLCFSALAVFSYVVPVSLLKLFTGLPFPVITTAGFIAMTSLVITGFQWWTGNRILRIGVMLVFTIAGYTALRLISNDTDIIAQVFLLATRLAGGLNVTEFVVIAAFVAGLMTVTILGVNMQRHGDTIALPGSGVRAGSLLRGIFVSQAPETFFESVGNFLRLPCPVSSAVLAEYWREIATRGVPLLLTALTNGVWALLFFSLDDSPPTVVLVTVAFFVITLILAARNSNTFGIRRKQGNTYVGTYDRTRPLSVLLMAAVKVSAALLNLMLAWLTLLALILIFGPLVDETVTDMRNQAIDFAASFSAYQMLGLVFSFWLQVASLIALVAAIHGLSLLSYRYLLPAVCVAASMVVLLFGFVTGGSVHWLLLLPAACSMLLLWPATVLMFLSLHRDGIFNRTVTTVVLACWIGYGMLYVRFFQQWGWFDASAPNAFVVLLGATTILPLSASALTPWVLSRVRSQ